MDIDSLTKQAETIVRCVLAQDTTEYLEMLNVATTGCMLIETLPVTADGAMKTMSYDSVLDIGLRTRFLFKWLQGGMLQHPRFDTEIRRKPRKGHGRSTLGGAREPMASAAGDENDVRKNSNVIVFWGRTEFGFTDRCYFNDDGTIALIERNVALVDDPSKPEYVQERASFISEGKSRVNPQFVRPPVLDFSFKDLTDVVDLLRTDPDAGRNKKPKERAQRHKRAKVYVPKEEKVDERNIIFNPNAGGEGAQDFGPQRVMIRAKNRKGEEEAYEFNVIEDEKKASAADKDDGKDDVIAALSKSMRGSKYSADSIRLCNNLFPECDKIVPVLRSLVVDSVLTVTWIDLSCNRLTSLPVGLEQLHLLSTLYLHGNNISNWEPVRALRRTLNRVHTVTLYGNPIATSNKDYKEIALSILLAPPPSGGAKPVPLKSLDFVVVSKQDQQVTKMYEQFHPSLDKKKENAAKIKERTQRLQATMLDF